MTTGTALGVPHPASPGKPGSLHPGGEPLSAAHRRAGGRARPPPASSDDDLDAARQLVLSHLRLVVAVQPQVPGLRAAAGGPDPGRQHRAS